MIDKETWLAALIEKLIKQYGSRLLFVGLQGSYQRGEATEDSDFDVVMVLDKLMVHDLTAYRGIIQTMPEHEKACGFICGKKELLSWPKYELFQLSQETKSYYGDLAGLLPTIDEQDIRSSIRIGAANLYHAVCHLYLYGNQSTLIDDLKQAYKSVFFIMQVDYYLKTGEYIHTKKEFVVRLNGDEQKLLDINLNWNNYKSAISTTPDVYFELLINWCSGVLQS